MSKNDYDYCTIYQEKRKVKIYAKSEYFPGFTFNLCCRIIMATVGKTEKRGA